MCCLVSLVLYSDYKGWTCVHHAASEGYTQTIKILLSASIKLLDKTDEDGVGHRMFTIRIGIRIKFIATVFKNKECAFVKLVPLNIEHYTESNNIEILKTNNNNNNNKHIEQIFKKTSNEKVQFKGAQ